MGTRGVGHVVGVGPSADRFVRLVADLFRHPAGPQWSGGPTPARKTGAVLGLLGAADVPLVIMSTRWFRGMHPVTPEMEPLMRWTLLINVVAFTVLFICLAFYRRSQLRLRQQIEDLQASYL